MWSTIILILLVLIFLLSALKISLDVKRNRPRGFIIKEGVIFLLILIVLTIVDVRFATKFESEERSAEPAEDKPQITREEDREKKLLSQIRDYTGALSYTDKPQVELFLRQGLEHKVGEEYSDALEIFRQALDLNLTDQERLAVFVLMGNAEAHLAEYNAAINYYFQAERLCKQTGNDTALAVVFSNLAIAHQLQDDLDGSLEYYFNLLEVVRRTGHVVGEKNTLANIGFVYQMKGEQDSASFYHKRSLEIVGSDLDLLGEAAEMNNLALIYRSMGQLDTALLLHERALQLFEKAGDRKNQASVLSNIGLIYQETGELEKALGYHHQAFGIDSTMGDVMGQAGDLTNIGSVLEQREELVQAKKSYERALTLFQSMDAREEVEFVRENIRRVAGKLKE